MGCEARKIPDEGDDRAKRDEIDSTKNRHIGGATELANFDNNKGHVVGERAVAPRGRAVEDYLFHFGKWSGSRLADQLLKAVDAKHVAPTVEDLYQAIRVQH